MLENSLAGLFLFLLIIISTSFEFNLNHFHTPQLQTRNFETAIVGKVLNVSLVFLSLNVSNDEECMFKCLVYRDCFSYNLESRETKLMLCGLSSKDRFSGLQHFVPKTGYRHRSILTGCSKKPCPEGKVCIPDLQTTSSYLCWLPYIDIEIKGYGVDDPQRGEESFFKINGKKYPLDKKYRGHSFRVVTYNGDVTIGTRTTFDTYGDRAAAAKMNSYINAIPANSIILVLVYDSGNSYLNTNALRSIGATSPALLFREAWAFVGFKGKRKPWMVEKKTTRGGGPAIVSTRIPYFDFLEL